MSDVLKKWQRPVWLQRVGRGQKAEQGGYRQSRACQTMLKTGDERMPVETSGQKSAVLDNGEKYNQRIQWHKI